MSRKRASRNRKATTPALRASPPRLRRGYSQRMEATRNAWFEKGAGLTQDVAGGGVVG